MFPGFVEGRPGSGFTVTVTVAGAVQFVVPSSPVTVYVVDVVGFTVCVAPVAPEVTPEPHVYVEPPVAVKTTASPEHTVEGDADNVTTGAAFEITSTSSVPTQPLPSVPVTVYVVVVEVGGVNDNPLLMPPDQV